MSFVSNGVDPRTGQYTVSVSLPTLNGNNFCGPKLPISLTFNPINNHDSGYGIGWNLALSQYDPNTKVLALYTGETFKVDGSGAAPSISEQKLVTFKFYDEGNARYRIVHKSGLVEVLELRGSQSLLLALPIELHSPLGHRLYLSYQSSGGYQRLHEVKQADGRVLLRLARNGTTLDIRYLGANPSVILAQFLCLIDSGQLRQLVLPDSEGAIWAFTYLARGELTCMQTVRSPFGAQETIEYDGQGHLYPGISRTALPRVSRHIVTPGRDQASIETRYEYSSHNFLGYGAAGLVFPTDNTDALYKIRVPYEYHCIQTRWRDGVPGRSVKFVYNRYHLLTEEVTRNGNALLITATEYHLDDSMAFDLQLPQCQLPRKVTTRWALADDPTRLRDEVEHSVYDSYGNLVEKTATNGSRETWQYYSALGEPGCPADPQGFTRHLKQYQQFPAPAPAAPLRQLGAFGPRAAVATVRPAPRYNDEPTLISRFTYLALQPLAGGRDPIIAQLARVDSQCLQGQETELSQTRHFYIDAPQDPLRHGQALRTEDHINGHVAAIAYSYDLAARPGALTATDTLTHSLDGSTTQVVRQLDLYTGLLLEERNAEGLIMAYEYDALQRLISETAMPGDGRYAATRRYRYKLARTAGQFAEQWEVNARGVETWRENDGLGRTLRVSRQKADGSASAQAFRLQYSARFGDDQDLLEVTHYDWLGDEPLALTQSYEYDQWDQCVRTLDGQGIAHNSVVDPFTRTLTRWQDGMASTVTQFDALEKPLWVEVRGVDGTRLARQESHYDGHGQLRLAIGANGERTGYDYDAYGRTVRNTLADGTQVAQHYASHSSSTLVTRLQVSHGNRALPDALAGTREYDGLERVTQSRVGPRIQRYLYAGSQQVPQARITPSQQRIGYEYNLVLSDRPTAIRAQQDCTFEYDNVSAALTRAVSPEGSLEYQYDNHGQMTLRRSEVDGQSRPVRYLTSPAGRLRQREDFSGLSCDYQYDAQGRVQALQEGQLRATFEYNAQGQRQRTTSHDLATGNQLVTRVDYDERGRETLRVQHLSRAPEYRTALVWGNDGQLLQREQRIGGQLSLLETFTYDARDRLVRHCCSGADLPVDPYGNAISEQLFFFDGLDNLLYCTSYFSDGREDHAEHHYADDDRCQLRSVRHSHPDYPAETLYSYDADGNLLADAEGRAMQYDHQGRLLRVEWPQGTLLSRYRYDAHDKLLGVTPGNKEETLRFYEADQLQTTVQGSRHASFTYDGATPLAQQQAGATEHTLLTLCGSTNSVLAEVKGDGAIKQTQYTAYGAASEMLDSLLGFNGEVREDDTGWYLLGSGYRAYDPRLRRFHSPDSESPFGSEGLNPYAYCIGNPIRYRDPSGHYPRPTPPDRTLERLRKQMAGPNALKNLLFGALFVAVGVGLSVLTGGFSMTMVAFGVGELLVRTAIEYEITRIDKHHGILQALSYADYAMLGLSVIYIARGLTKSKKVVEDVVDEIVDEALPTKGSYSPPKDNSLRKANPDPAPEGGSTSAPDSTPTVATTLDTHPKLPTSAFALQPSAGVATSPTVATVPVPPPKPAAAAAPPPAAAKQVASAAGRSTPFSDFQTELINTVQQRKLEPQLTIRAAVAAVKGKNLAIRTP